MATVPTDAAPWKNGYPTTDGKPMAATDYMTEPGLRALVRNPKSVRTWPQQQMPAFSPTVLPDTDLNALVAYLKQIASQRGR